MYRLALLPNRVGGILVIKSFSSTLICTVAFGGTETIRYSGGVVKCFGCHPFKKNPILQAVVGSVVTGLYAPLLSSSRNGIAAVCLWQRASVKQQHMPMMPANNWVYITIIKTGRATPAGRLDYFTNITSSKQKVSSAPSGPAIQKPSWLKLSPVAHKLASAIGILK